MIAAGMPESYVEYLMGQSPDTYNDIQSKGVEFLRNQYAKADLRIHTKTEETAYETLARLARQLGKEPTKAFNKDYFSEPHRIMVSQQDTENAQFILAKLRELANS